MTPNPNLDFSGGRWVVFLASPEPEIDPKISFWGPKFPGKTPVFDFQGILDAFNRENRLFYSSLGAKKIDFTIALRAGIQKTYQYVCNVCLPPKTKKLAYRTVKTHVTQYFLPNTYYKSLSVYYKSLSVYYKSLSVYYKSLFHRHKNDPPGPPPVQGRFLARQLDLVLGFPTRIWVFWPKPHVFGKKHPKIDFWVIFCQ